MTGISRGRYASSTVRVVLYTYAYVFLEWIFLVTKPSFLGTWTLTERIQALLVGVIPFLLVALGVHALACVLAFGASRFWPRSADYLLRLVPALIVATIALIMVDNFTYTMFGWGIVKTTWHTVPIYWVLLLVAGALHLRRTPTVRSRLKPILAAVLLVTTCGTLAWSLLASDRYQGGHYASALSSPLPNIIMFASDGVNANHMSAYGYARKTTPNLDAWMDRALVADNAFTNAGWTTGSLTSMMTGKYPATTKVMYPPNTLAGADAYESLPRILHQLGYASLQETLRYYADGPDLNWKDSFDFANGRAVPQSRFDDTPLGLQGPLLFGERLRERLSRRLGQVLLRERMVDRHAAVTSNTYAEVYGISDEKRMATVADFIGRAKQPFFIHIHLMGTHCCVFDPKHKKFSAQEFASKEERKTAAFDDTILQSDRYFGQLMEQLESQHLLDNTLVVYSSDHTTDWDFRTQVPLIFLFPGNAHHGHFTATTQLLDVAPTILDYLQVPVPGWMEGTSLLSGAFSRDRPIFSIYRTEREKFSVGGKHQLARVPDIGPPTYGVKWVGLVVCQRWYGMVLKSQKVYDGPVPDYREKCPAELMPDIDQARIMMNGYLHDRGFNY